MFLFIKLLFGICVVIINNHFGNLNIKKNIFLVSLFFFFFLIYGYTLKSLFLNFYFYTYNPSSQLDEKDFLQIFYYYYYCNLKWKNDYYKI